MTDYHEYDPYGVRQERERQADWSDNLEAWRQARDDALTRDRGERKVLPAYPNSLERARDAGYADGDPKGMDA